MPSYLVDIPGQGSFQVDSEQELNEQQAYQYAITQTQAPTQPVPEQPVSPIMDYLNRTARRGEEAIKSFVGLPIAVKDIVTGGELGRVDAMLRTLAGVGAPISALMAPVAAAGESAAKGFGAEEDLSRTIGTLTELASTFGVGWLAKANKLGETGLQLAKVLGVGRVPTLAEAAKHDPHLKFVLNREYPTVKSPELTPLPAPLEKLAHTSASAEDLAMAAKSPSLAQSMLQQKEAVANGWATWAKEGEIITDAPDTPTYKPNDHIAFNKNQKDLGIFGTLGTPARVAMKINPQAGAAALEMQLAEMNIGRAIEARQARNAKALLGVGDKELQEAVKWRETPNQTHEQLMANPAINEGVKNVLKFINNKFGVDRDIIISRLREQARERITKQVERDLKKSAEPWGEAIDPRAVGPEVEKRLKDAIPDSWGIDQYLTHIFPGYYKIITKDGQVIGSANTKLEAKYLINERAAELGLSAKDIFVQSHTYFDSDLLHLFKGRVSRAYDSIAKGTALDESEIAAAIKGQYGFSKRYKFFSSLLERGNAKGYTQDLLTILNTYDRGIERWMQLSDLAGKVTPTFKELTAKGYPALSDMLQNTMQSLWGRRIPLSLQFDNTIAAIPGLNQVVAPYALDRMVGATKSGIVGAFLKYNPRFQALNATQTLSTLWPIADFRTITEGIKLRNSELGKGLLDKHGISTVGSKVEGMAKSLGFSERFNQETAFLTMYNHARKLGLDDVRAADYAKIRGNVYSQFLGLTTDRPYRFTTMDPTGLMFMFQRFPIKQLEMVLDLMKDRNFPGAAKWLGVNLALGGFKAATFGQAGWLTYKMYKDIEKEYGGPVADLFHVGLPGLVGIDMSNSVMLANPPFGDSWQEKLGNLLGGVVGSTASSVLGSMMNTAGPEPNLLIRATQALAQRVPIFKSADALARAFSGNYDFKDPLGRLRFKGDFGDVVKRFLGARTLKEADLDTFASAIMEVESRRNDILNFAASRYGQMQLIGSELGSDMKEVIQKEVTSWNSMWPEFPILGNEILERAARRQQAAMQDLRTRLLRQAPAALKRTETFMIPPGGG